jgi:hypothetical protein
MVARCLGHRHLLASTMIPFCVMLVSILAPFYGPVQKPLKSIVRMRSAPVYPKRAVAMFSLPIELVRRGFSSEWDFAPKGP